MASRTYDEIYRWTKTLTTVEYVEGLSGIAERISESQRRLLVAQYHAPNRAVTSPQLAVLAGIDGGYPVVNVQYGKLARMFLEYTKNKADLRDDGTDRLWSAWSIGYRLPEGWIWEMLPQVAEAIETLGWATEEDVRSPDEVVINGKYAEGSVCRIMVNAYERNRNARDKCIEFHGVQCVICGLDFSLAYGPEFEGLIHVHHLRPLSEIGEEYSVDPERDLRPVCPNCHAVIHWQGLTRSIDEVVELVQRQK